MHGGEPPTSSQWRGATSGGAPAGDSVGEASPKSTPGAHPCEEEADPAVGVVDQEGHDHIWPLVASNDL
jgi:hypothetical protein